MKKIAKIYKIIPCLLFIGCQTKETLPVKTEKYCLNEDIKKKITIATIEQQPFTETFTLTGNIAYDADNIVPFVSLVEGIITKTFFSLGDYVKKGQVLAEIKSTELNNLQAENKSLQSQLSVAQRQLQTIQSMYDDGIASHNDLVKAESELEIIKSSLENTKNNLSLFSPSMEKFVFQIKAPTDGYIVTKNVSPGTQISQNNEALFTISNLKQVWVMANIYSTNLAHIKENMVVSIKTPAYPNEIFNGKISAFSQVFDAEEHVLKARIMMENPDLKLKPGMSADIILNKNATGEKMAAIPAGAMIFDDNKNYILIYKDDCELEIREINPSGKNNDWIYLDKNISVGEKIITKNHLLIYERLKG